MSKSSHNMTWWQKEPIHAWAPCIQVAYSHFEQGCILHSKKRSLKATRPFYCHITVAYHKISSQPARYVKIKRDTDKEPFYPLFHWVLCLSPITQVNWFFTFLLACSDFKWCRFTCHLDQKQFFFEVRQQCMQLSNFTLIWHLILCRKGKLVWFGRENWH